jgi:hypothetical protein
MASAEPPAPVESRRAWAEGRGRDDRGLGQRADAARGASEALEKDRGAIPAASREQRDGAVQVRLGRDRNPAQR